MKIDKTSVKFIVFITIVILIAIIFWTPFTKLLSNVENVKQSVENTGALAPLVFICIIILQVLFAPIPGQIVAMASGYIFGVWRGFIYMMIGSTIASFTIFFFSRKFGRPFVEKILKKKTIKKMDKFVANGGGLALFLMYLLPFFPDDAICYLAGLTKIKIRNLVLISIFGRFPEYLLLCFIGAGFAMGSKLSIIALSSFSVLLIILYLKRDQLEKFIMNKNAKART